MIEALLKAHLRWGQQRGPRFEGGVASWPEPPDKTAGFVFLNADCDYLRNTHFLVTEAALAKEEMRLAKNADRALPSGFVCSARLA